MRYQRVSGNNFRGALQTPDQRLWEREGRWAESRWQGAAILSLVRPHENTFPIKHRFRN